VTRDEVVAIVRRNIAQVLPEVDHTQLVAGRSLSELGANSIDRMDVVVGAMADLDLDVPGHRLAGVRDIGSLVDVLWACSSETDR
jgi:polyketide biosynthesis acyl carrier protein